MGFDTPLGHAISRGYLTYSPKYAILRYKQGVRTW